MARKRGKSERVGHKRVWEDEDVVQLRGWLDYCLQEEIDYKNTIVDHLKAKTGKDFVLQQVHDKIKREWKNLGHEDSETVDDVYQQGTNCLVCLTQEERKAIQHAMDSYGPPVGQHQLRVTSSTLRSQSYSRPIAPLSSETSTLSSLASIDTSEIEGTRSGCFRTDDRPTRLNDDSNAKQIDKERFLSPPPLLLQVKSINERKPQQDASSSEIKTESFAVHRNASLDLRAISGADDDNSRLPVMERELSVTQKDLSSAQIKLRRLQSQVFTLNNQLCAVQRDCDGLRHCMRAAVTNQDKIASLQGENLVLRKQLLAIENTRQNVKKIETYGLELGDRELWNESLLVSNNISDACSSLSLHNLLREDVREVLSLEELDFAPMLSVWADRVSGLDIWSLLHRCLELKISHHELLRSLVGAAICTLVFEPRFTDLMAIASPILDHYRTQVLNRDGLHALHQLDLLAYKSLISESYFESHIIPEKAKDLSEQLCRSIEPFFASESKIDSEGLFWKDSETQENGQQSQSEIDDVTPTDLFAETFQHALNFKAKLLFSARDFKWVFFSPGQTYDPQIMDSKLGNSNLISPRRKYKQVGHGMGNNSKDKEEIKLCLSPALYKLPVNNSTHAYSLSLWNEPRASHNSDGVQEYQLIVKAIVLD